jgi:myo-inositol 2-dehydrogenase/D-chiro-inositol 1-dehydrogenase
MTHDSGTPIGRRQFIQKTAAAGAAVTTFGILNSANADTKATGETLKVGLIGCGGRGTGAAREALLADKNVKLVAMADTFKDNIASAREKLKKSEAGDRVVVDDGHMFDGFDGYKQLIDVCDVIVHATTPGFRPLHMRAIAEAGKHCFIEKPVAVDPVGVRSVMESAKMLKEKGKCLVSGLCYRYQFSKRDIIQQIHDGKIGDILTMQTTYNTGGLWHKGRDEKWSDMEYQIRNWLYFDWLSGDHINEQHIHSLDKIMWVMKDTPPVKCTASGGRAQRTDPKYGNIYDHFNGVYEWENGVKCFNSCRQWESTSTDVTDWITGDKGTAELQSHSIQFRDGSTWNHEPKGEDNMYQNEHNALFAGIRAGEVLNDGDYMCKSTMIACMARMSAYTGKTVTWDQMMNSKLDTFPKTIAWGDNPVNPVPVPGETDFV